METAAKIGVSRIFGGGCGVPSGIRQERPNRDQNRSQMAQPKKRHKSGKNRRQISKNRPDVHSGFSEHKGGPGRNSNVHSHLALGRRKGGREKRHLASIEIGARWSGASDMEMDIVMEGLGDNLVQHCDRGVGEGRHGRGYIMFDRRRASTNVDIR